MADHKRQLDDLPRDEYERDLNPDPLAGQNIGQVSDETGRPHRSAFDLKPVHRALSSLPDDELRTIPILEEGSPLRQGATYINLADAGRREITARGDMRVGPGEAFIPKDDVPYTTWNRLRGVDSPERTGGEPMREP